MSETLEKQWQNLFLQVKFACSLKVQKPFLYTEFYLLRKILSK